MLKATTVWSSENGYRRENGSTWRFSEFGSRGKELEKKHRKLKRSVMKVSSNRRKKKACLKKKYFYLIC